MFGKTTPEKQLFKAIKCGDLDGVKALIDGRVDNGLDIDCVFKNEDTPLTFAIAQKKYTIALYLIEKNADVNKSGSSNKGSFKPLSLCLDNPDVQLPNSLARKTFEELVKKGAYFYNVSNFNRNILHLSSCHFSYPSIFKYCLSKVETLEELKSYTNREGQTLETAIIDSVCVSAYTKRRDELKAQATPAVNVTTQCKDVPHIPDVADISDVTDVDYERIGSHTLCVTTPLSGNRSLLEVFNFAHKRIVTSINEGTPARHRFSDEDQDGLQSIADKLDELGGHAGEDWKEVFSNTIRKGKTTLPKGVKHVASK